MSIVSINTQKKNTFKNIRITCTSIIRLNPKKKNKNKTRNKPDTKLKKIPEHVMFQILN